MTEIALNHTKRHESHTLHNNLPLHCFALLFLLSFTTKASDTELMVKAKGSKANGVYSHFKVIVNDLECGGKSTSSSFEEYYFSIPFSKDEIEEIKIVFDNDFYSIGEDRNLCVYSIVINDEIPIKANKETVKCICVNGAEYEYCGMMEWNSTLVFDVKKLRFHPGNVVLSTQKEVDLFSHQYIEGSLTISGEDIHDLSPLSILTSIKGALIIENNPNLTSINGLNSLLQIGYLRINNNSRLKQIDAFNTLEKCGGMSIHQNGSLHSIKCMEALGI